MNKIIVKTVDFKAFFPDIEYIRLSVFVREQNVPLELEWDEDDHHATHILAWYNQQAVATARLLANGRIGRMAVLKKWRGKGVGKTMLQYLLQLASQQSLPTVHLSAQQHAVAFYEKHGFQINSECYMDAGIPHYTMIYSCRQNKV